MRVVIAALVLILLTASPVSANGGGHTPVSICHSGNGKHYTWISPDQAATTGNGHANHDHDVFGLSEAECLAKNATPEPTIEPTVSPTDEPTPTQEPTSEPTTTPTPSPVVEPTPTATVDPTAPSLPTPSPTSTPTVAPTVETTPTPQETEPVVTEEPTDEPVPTTPIPTPTAGDSSTPTPSPEQPAPTDDGRGTLPPSSGGTEVVAEGTTGVVQRTDGPDESGVVRETSSRVDTLPDTGTGPEPSIMPTVLMAIAGATLAASAWGIRRKV